MKKIIIGIVLMLFIFVNDFSHITDWGSGEFVGYNLWALFLPILGLFLLIKGIKNYNSGVTPKNYKETNQPKQDFLIKKPKTKDSSEENKPVYLILGFIILIGIIIFAYANLDGQNDSTVNTQTNIQPEIASINVSKFYDGLDGYSLSIPDGNKSTCTWTYSGGSGRIPYLETTTATNIEKHHIRYEAGSFYDFSVNCTDDFGNRYVGVFPNN